MSKYYVRHIPNFGSYLLKRFFLINRIEEGDFNIEKCKIEDSGRGKS